MIEEVRTTGAFEDTGNQALQPWTRGMILPPNPAIGLLKPHRKSTVVVIQNPGDERPSMGYVVKSTANEDGNN